MSSHQTPSKTQFDATHMRKYQGPNRHFVANLEDGPMLGALCQVLLNLERLLSTDNHPQYIDQSTALVKNIESAEHSFFTTKYQSNFPDLTEPVIDSMARNAASISDDQGRFQPMRLKSRVDYWTAHPSNFGETRPEFTNSLHQIVVVLNRLNSQLQPQEESYQSSMATLSRG